jgi:hypothetical protein
VRFVWLEDEVVMFIEEEKENVNCGKLPNK